MRPTILFIPVLALLWSPLFVAAANSRVASFLQWFFPSPRTSTTRAQTVDSFDVFGTIPHDTLAFTQGLTFDPENSDIIYESTGMYTQSSVRILDINTGEVLKLKKTPNNIFGEGLAFYKTAANEKRLIHITWKSQQGFIFDATTLDVVQTFQFTTQRNEGWGITYNPHTDQFIVTDGSEYLHFWDASTLQEMKRIPVMLQPASSSTPAPSSTNDCGDEETVEAEAEAVTNLNEIEWDDQTQTILANVWQTDMIVRIDPASGSVITQYDLSDLYTCREPMADVLNGIAISPNRDLWVTGKRWPHMYKIKFNE